MMTVNDVMAKLAVPAAVMASPAAPLRLRIESFERVGSSLDVSRDVHVWVGNGKNWVNVGMALDGTDQSLDCVERWDGSEDAVYRAIFQAAGIRLSSNTHPHSPLRFDAAVPAGLDTIKLSALLPSVACSALHFEESFNPVTGRFDAVQVYVDDQTTPAYVFSRDSMNLTLECSDILKRLVVETGLVSNVELSFSEDVFDSHIWSPVQADASFDDLDEATLAAFMKQVA